jgi:hypothetical protein
MLEGKKVATTLGDMSAVMNIFSVQTPPAPKQSDGSGPVSAEAQAEFEEAFRQGYYVAIATTVVQAQAANPRPQLRLVKMVVRARGECLFKAVCCVRDADAAACRDTVIDLLASKWGRPCSAGVARRGHVSCTVGKALQAEHGRTFKGGAEWAAWMRKSNAAGGVPWSTTVEIQELANLLSAIIRVLVPTRDKGLALRDCYFPSGGPTMPTIDILYACGHFDGLAPLDSLSPKLAGKAMALSESAWDVARLAAAAASIGFLASLGLANLAEESAGGPAQLAALALAAAEAEAARALEADAVPLEFVRDIAVGLVSQEVGRDSSDAIALLADSARLSRAVSAFLAPAAADSAAVEEADGIPELVADGDEDATPVSPAAVAAAAEGRAGGSRVADVEVRHPPTRLLPRHLFPSQAHPSHALDGPALVMLPGPGAGGRCGGATRTPRPAAACPQASRSNLPPHLPWSDPVSPLPPLPFLSTWHVCAGGRVRVVSPRQRTRVPRIRFARGP